MYKAEMILPGRNIPLNIRHLVAVVLNDHELGFDYFNESEYFIDYVLYYFPIGIIKKRDCNSPFITLIEHNYRLAEISLELQIRCLKKDKSSVYALMSIIKHLAGIDNEDKFIKYVNNFGNYESEDFQLFIAHIAPHEFLHKRELVWD